MADDKRRSSDEDTKENLNIRAIQEKAQQTDSSHMGAEENQVTQKKPPTDDLAKLSGEALDKGKKKDTEYDPVDEITPG